MTAPSQSVLVALQRGLPLEPRPFAALAREIGCSEDDLLDAVAKARAGGIVRRFGAVFDVRRLGYRSALCAAVVADDADADAAAARVTPLTGVTHCYRRFPHGETSAEGMPTLWFTLSCPADVFPAMCDEVRSRLAPRQVEFLAARRRYKVDVVLGGAARAREESVADDLPPVDARDRAIIGTLQGDTEVRPDYFTAIAARLGMKEWDLLSTLEMWSRSGRLRRIGLLLAHRNAGWTANGMCCWNTGGDSEAAGRVLAACGEVTHCYERESFPFFPYDLFAMVHAHSAAEAEDAHQALSAVVAEAAGGVLPTAMLVSTREYKKTSMTFFSVNDEMGAKE